jgi:hypothetical protein
MKIFWYVSILACSLTAAKYKAASTFLLAVAQLQADEFVV